MSKKKHNKEVERENVSWFRVRNRDDDVARLLDNSLLKVCNHFGLGRIKWSQPLPPAVKVPGKVSARQLEPIDVLRSRTSSCDRTKEQVSDFLLRRHLLHSGSSSTLALAVKAALFAVERRPRVAGYTGERKSTDRCSPFR